MTLVIATLTTQDNIDVVQIWADSRVAGASKILDSAPKLLPVSVKIFGADNSIVHETIIGFGFSGSTLISLSTYAFLNSALQLLKLGPDEKLPSMTDIGVMAANSLWEYAQELGSNTGRGTRTAIWVSGYCEERKRMMLLEFETSTDSGSLKVKPKFHDLYEKNEADCRPAFIMGDAVAKEKLSELCTDKGIHPISGLLHCIQDDAITSVGGNLQMMAVSSKGVKILPILRTSPQGNEKLTLLNRDITDTKIGECGLNTFAMSFD